MEQNELGAVVQPVDKPQSEPIRVAYVRIQKCPDETFGQLVLRVKLHRNQVNRILVVVATVDSTVARQQSGGTDRVVNQCWKDCLRPR